MDCFSLTSKLSYFSSSRGSFLSPIRAILAHTAAVVKVKDHVNTLTQKQSRHVAITPGSMYTAKRKLKSAGNYTISCQLSRVQTALVQIVWRKQITQTHFPLFEGSPTTCKDKTGRHTHKRVTKIYTYLHFASGNTTTGRRTNRNTQIVQSQK